MTAGPGGVQRLGRVSDPDVATGRQSAGEGQPTRTPRSGFRGDIEGLRAIAVGTVLIYHMGISFMPGGFVGVDIFFVISGFLITSLLIREVRANGRISLVDFYARRARRLLPPASTVLMATGLAGWFLLPGAERANLGTDVLAATFYVINWALALRSVDYLAEDAAPSALQHYWSLSVEEQFYLIWPLLIIGGLHLARRIRVRPMPLLLAMLGALALASFVYSVVHTEQDPTTAYFATTTRVWQLAVGALLAFVVGPLGRLPKAAAEVIGALGLVLIGYSALVLGSGTPWPGSWALAPTLGAGLVIAAGCASDRTATARLLGLRPMVWVGGLSYAIYLWHWPLITIAKVAHPGLGLRWTILLGLLSIPLAWVTKRVVEDPIRFHPALAKNASRSLLFGLCAMVLTGLVGAFVLATAPRVDRDAEVKGATQLVVDPTQQEWEVKQGKALAEVLPTSGSVVPDPAAAPEDVPSYYEDECQVQQGVPEPDTSCVYGNRDGDTTIALLGDSKMGQWFPAVEGIADHEDWRVELYLKSACAFTYRGADSDCNAFGRNVMEHFDEHGAPDIALVSQGAAESADLQDGEAAAIEDLQARGTKVVIVADSPRPDIPEVYTCVDENPDGYGSCGFPPEKGAGEEGTGTPNLEAVAAATKTPFVDLNEWICPPGGTCPPVIGHTLVYRQGSHVTASYVRTLTPMLYRALAEQDLTERTVPEISIDMIPG